MSGVRRPAPTKRELEALRAVAQPGSSVVRAAYDLGLTQHALEKRLHSVYRRLDVDSAAQAIYKLRHEL